MASKNFVLRVRWVEVSDMRQGVSSLPEPGDYSMYLEALHEEISGSQIISAVVRTDTAFHLSTSVSVSAEDLCARLKPLFSGDFFDKLRCVSLLEA